MLSVAAIAAAGAGQPRALATVSAPEATARIRQWLAHKESAQPYHESVPVLWNDVLLHAVRAVRFAPMFTARALAIMHGCMYDAWAAYEALAGLTDEQLASASPRSRH